MTFPKSEKKKRLFFHLVSKQNAKSGWELLKKSSRFHYFSNNSKKKWKCKSPSGVGKRKIPHMVKTKYSRFQTGFIKFTLTFAGLLMTILLNSFYSMNDKFLEYRMNDFLWGDIIISFSSWMMLMRVRIANWTQTDGVEFCRNVLWDIAQPMSYIKGVAVAERSRTLDWEQRSKRWVQSSAAQANNFSTPGCKNSTRHPQSG